VIQGTDRIIIDANERLCTMPGYSREELVRKSAALSYSSYEEYERAGCEKYRQIALHGIGAVETCWNRKDGSLLDIYLASTPIHPADRSRGVTFSALDISTYKPAVVRQAAAPAVPTKP
jgi:PAS domain S-box-containing protein